MVITMSDPSCNTCQNNQHPCTCPESACGNHGKCCDCVAHHREIGTPPMCMRDKQA